MDSAVPVEAARASPANQRRHFRYKIRNLAYVTLGPDNGGILRDVSETGVSIQSVRPLTPEECVPVRFELLRPRARVEGSGRVVWTDSTNQAGLELLELSQRSRRSLKEWLFTQVLQSGNATGPIFVQGQADFADAMLPAEVVSGAAESLLNQTVMNLPWWPVPITAARLAKLIDSLAVASAVLLFSVVVLAITHMAPAWPLALLLAVVIAAMFSGVYWIVFMVCMGNTAGAILATHLSSQSRELEEEDQPRFR